MSDDRIDCLSLLVRSDSSQKVPPKIIRTQSSWARPREFAGNRGGKADKSSNTRRLSEVISLIKTIHGIAQKFVDVNGCETINLIASLVSLVQHRGMPEVQAPPRLPKSQPFLGGGIARF
jgi:hypothetical protein